jgi:O-acetyl-ADP-ribose deacetylase (regulator of RNase III)
MATEIDLWLVHPARSMCEAFQERFAGLPRVSVHQCGYEDLPPHDCFVTAGNSFGLMTAGVDAVVVHVHGRALMDAIQERILNEYLGEQPVGTAFIEATHTPGYPYVAHAPTMRVPAGIDGTDKVYAATWASLVAVRNFNVIHDGAIRTVAFPAMGAGFGGVPEREAARQMAVAYRHSLDPPRHLDWDQVVDRHRAIVYDGDERVVR